MLRPRRLPCPHRLGTGTGLKRMVGLGDRAACQAEAISPDEPTERRRPLADPRRGVGRQPAQRRELRRRHAKAQEVTTAPTAFCERVRGRLDEDAPRGTVSAEFHLTRVST